MNIQENCSSIEFGTAAPRFERQSRKIREVAATTGHVADENRLRGSKYLFPKKSTDRYIKIARSFRLNVINVYSLPWGDNGRRIIANQNLDRFQNNAEHHMLAFMMEVDEFWKSVPNLLESCAIELGEYFDASEYPTFQSTGNDWEIQRAGGYIVSVMHNSGLFGMHYAPGNIESSEVANRGLDASTREAWEAMAEARLQTAVQNATGDVWSRVALQVSRMAKTLNDDKAPIHASTIQNLRELVDCMDGFNLGADPALDTMAREIRQELTIREADALRKDKGAREAQGKAARGVLTKVAESPAGKAALSKLANSERKDQKLESNEARALLTSLNMTF